jgi:hypothetical protein
VRAGLLLVVSVLAGTACIAVVGDFNAGIGGGPPTSSASSSGSTSAASSSSSSSSSTGGMCFPNMMTCLIEPPQCCPGSGEHCIIDPTTFAPICELAGSKKPGEPCQSDDECAGISLCDDPGLCRAVCTADSDCGANNFCGDQVYMQQNGSDVPVGLLCGDVCNPTVVGSSSSCPATFKCDLTENYGPSLGKNPWYTACILDGTTPPGGSCALHGDCVAGSGCFGTMNTTCQQYCDFASSAANKGCPAGRTCTDLSPPATNIRGLHIGTCL